MFINKLRKMKLINKLKGFEPDDGDVVYVSLVFAKFVSEGGILPAGNNVYDSFKLYMLENESEAIDFMFMSVNRKCGTYLVRDYVFDDLIIKIIFTMFCANLYEHYVKCKLESEKSIQYLESSKTVITETLRSKIRSLENELMKRGINEA